MFMYITVIHNGCACRLMNEVENIHVTWKTGTGNQIKYESTKKKKKKAIEEKG